MSYTEYLRRKASTQVNVVDTRPNKVSASEFIRERRLKTSATMLVNGNHRGVVNNIQDMANINPPHGLQSVAKKAGSVPDASQFTAYCGSNQYVAIGKYIQNSPNCIPGATNPIVAPVSRLNASDWTRNDTLCRTFEPHTANELGPPLFVDDTIRLKNYQACPANHTHPVAFSTRQIPPRRWANKARLPATTTTPDDARKVGQAIAKHKYVEKHHGYAIPYVQHL